MNHVSRLKGWAGRRNSGKLTWCLEKLIHDITQLLYSNNEYRNNAAKRLRRSSLSSFTAPPLLSHQPYYAAPLQDNRNIQGDVSHSAIFARQLDFCTGGKEDGVHCCLLARMILRPHVADGGVLSLCASVAVCGLTKRLICLYCLAAAHNLLKWVPRKTRLNYLDYLGVRVGALVLILHSISLFVAKVGANAQLDVCTRCPFACD